MKKENLGSKIVKKAITWAMIAMMSLSGVMSNMATLTAYAGEKEINNYVDDLGLSEEYVDSNKEKYHNDEAYQDRVAWSIHKGILQYINGIQRD